MTRNFSFNNKSDGPIQIVVHWEDADAAQQSEAFVLAGGQELAKTPVVITKAGSYVSVLAFYGAGAGLASGQSPFYSNSFKLSATTEAETIAVSFGGVTFWMVIYYILAALVVVLVIALLVSIFVQMRKGTASKAAAGSFAGSLESSIAPSTMSGASAAGAFNDVFYGDSGSLA